MGLLDSTAGNVFASTLHTAGAIAFLAGLAIFVAWSRGIRRGDEHPTLLTLGATLSYVAILANLMGGFMRTYQPGHPKFWEAFDEPWAMLMVIKHIFLFGGMFAVVYLYEVVAPRLRRRHQEAQGDLPVGRRESWAVIFTALSILISTVLGSVAAVTPITGMGSQEMPDHEMPGPEPSNPDEILFEETTLTFNGTLTSLPPLQPGTADGVLTMPDGVGQAALSLSWNDNVGVLHLEMIDPEGQAWVASDGDGVAELILIEPAAGRWQYVVSGENAVSVDYTLTAVLTPGENAQQLISGTVTIPPASSPVSIFEINLVMQLHGNLSWDWSVESGANIDFNLHTHFDGEVQYVVEKTASSDASRYMAVRTGGHSLMWENTGSVPLQVTYRAWGNFEVDSYFP